MKSMTKGGCSLPICLKELNCTVIAIPLLGMFTLKRKEMAEIDELIKTWRSTGIWNPYTYCSNPYIYRSYNPETHELVPKQSYIKQQLKEAEEGLEALKTEKINTIEAYDNRIREQKEKIAALKSKVG